MGSQFVTIEHWIAHIIFIVAGNALPDLHTLLIRLPDPVVGPGVVPFIAGKTFRVIFMRKPGCFYIIGGGTCQGSSVQTGIRDNSWINRLAVSCL
jgi:hypothetical protein